jgi:hypothetical protein
MLLTSKEWSAWMSTMKRVLSLLAFIGVFAFGIQPSGAQAPAPAVPSTPAPAASATYDFGDMTSATLTQKAWAAHEKKDVAAVKAFTGKCKEMFLAEAVKQQATLTAPAPKEKAFDYWALNDVGTCMFILGQALEASDDKAGAIAAYKLLVEQLSFAQCWDTKGWFWPPAGGAKQRLAALEFEGL